MTVSTAPVVDTYLSELDRALHGHRRDKRRLLQEVHDGLMDATAVQIRAGAPAEEASMRSVATFGRLEELVAEYQRELSIRQVRRTAARAAVIVPALLLFWNLIWSLDPYQQWNLPRHAVLLAEHLAGLGALTAVLGGATVALTGRLQRWLPVPRHLTAVTVCGGLAGAVAMSIAPLVLALASPPAAAAWPLTPLALIVASVPLVGMGLSAWSCRRYAR